MFENGQGVKPTDLSATWDDYKNKQIFKNNFFNRVVTQALLIFGSETWVLLAEM